MKLKDANDYHRRTGKVPANIVMAFDKPLAIGEVILHGPFPFRVAEALSRDEFMARVRASQKRPDAVAGKGKVKGFRIDTETAVDSPEPGPEFKYFYSAELVPGKGDGR